MKAGFPVATALLLFVAAPGAQGLGKEYLSVAAKVDSMTARAQQAIDAGNDAVAIDTFCQIVKIEGVQFVDPRFWIQVPQICEKRYVEVFTPPANADSMVPTSDWRQGFGSFNGPGVALRGDAGHSNRWVMRFRPPTTPDGGASYLVVDLGPPLSSAIDFDLDGKPEVTFDGREATIASGFPFAVDRAPDGRRVQWLVGRPGVDPRQKVAAWIVKDGPMFEIAVDTDGDGKGNCGDQRCTSE